MKQSTKDALIRYRDHHIQTGGFLQGVLENDLRLAWLRADKENRRDLGEIIHWITFEITRNAWGSREKVKSWIQPKNKPLTGYFKPHEVSEDPLEDPALRM